MGVPLFVNLCTLAALSISSYSILNHACNYNEPRLQLYIIRILMMVPVSFPLNSKVYALSSYFSLIFPEYFLYFAAMRDM